MKRNIIAVVTLCVAALGSIAAFTAVTLKRVAEMRLTQYAWDKADTTPVGIE